MDGYNFFMNGWINNILVAQIEMVSTDTLHYNSEAFTDTVNYTFKSMDVL